MRNLEVLLVPIFVGFLIGSAVCEETFDLDRTHSYIGFSIGFAGLTDVEGKFTDFKGSILYNSDDLGDSTVLIVVKTAQAGRTPYPPCCSRPFRKKDFQKQ